MEELLDVLLSTSGVADVKFASITDVDRTFSIVAFGIHNKKHSSSTSIYRALELTGILYIIVKNYIIFE